MAHHKPTRLVIKPWEMLSSLRNPHLYKLHGYGLCKFPHPQNQRNISGSFVRPSKRHLAWKVLVIFLAQKNLLKKSKGSQGTLMTGPWFQTSHQNPQNTAKHATKSATKPPTTQPPFWILLVTNHHQPSNQHFHGPTQPTVANPPSEIFRTAGGSQPVCDFANSKFSRSHSGLIGKSRALSRSPCSWNSWLCGSFYSP